MMSLLLSTRQIKREHSSPTVSKSQKKRRQTPCSSSQRRVRKIRIKGMKKLVTTKTPWLFRRNNLRRRRVDNRWMILGRKIKSNSRYLLIRVWTAEVKLTKQP